MEPSARHRGAYALPHTYQPNVSFLEAVVRVCGALARIFLGSAVFAICGAFAWQSWATIHNWALKLLALTAIGIVFAIAFAALMLAINTAVERVVRRVR